MQEADPPPVAQAVRGRIPSVLLVSGQALVLLSMLLHESQDPRILGRYSPAYATLIMGTATVLAGIAYGLRARRRQSVTRAVAAIARLLGLPEVLALAIPLAALFVVYRGSRYAFLIEPGVLLAGLTLVVLGALGFVHAALAPARAVRMWLRLGMLSVGAALAGLVLEIGLRSATRDFPYRVVPPELRAVFHAAPGTMPGVEGIARYSTTAEGFRNEADPPPDAFRIVAIGGSTTECLYLDDREAWPRLVQDRLQDAAPDPRVWVGNVGRSGHRAVHHLLALRRLSEQHDLDAVIVLVGINELLPVLRNPDGYGEDFREDMVRALVKTFAVRPLMDDLVRESPFPTNLASWSMLTRLPRPVDKALVEDRAGLSYVERRRRLQEARDRMPLPDFAPVLERYGRHLHGLFDAAEAAGLELVLVTQPVIWKEGLSPEARQLLWLAYHGDRAAPDGYYEPAELAKAMVLFNQRLLGVCRERGGTCIRLAEVLSGREELFYDDVHFNEAGSRAVADHVAAALLAGHFIAQPSPGGRAPSAAPAS